MSSPPDWLDRHIAFRNDCIAGRYDLTDEDVQWACETFLGAYADSWLRHQIRECDTFTAATKVCRQHKNMGAHRPGPPKRALDGGTIGRIANTGLFCWVGDYGQEIRGGIIKWRTFIESAWDKKQLQLALA